LYRYSSAFAACSFGALNFKEKLFIALSWGPKVRGGCVGKQSESS
jgi:hypothetical protein